MSTILPANPVDAGEAMGCLVQFIDWCYRQFGKDSDDAEKRKYEALAVRAVMAIEQIEALCDQSQAYKWPVVYNNARASLL
jgi:hypothetical protein